MTTFFYNQNKPVFHVDAKLFKSLEKSFLEYDHGYNILFQSFISNEL